MNNVLKARKAAKEARQKKYKNDDNLYADSAMKMNLQINSEKEGSKEEATLIKRRNRLEKAYKRSRDVRE